MDPDMHHRLRFSEEKAVSSLPPRREFDIWRFFTEHFFFNLVEEENKTWKVGILLARSLW